MASMAIAWAAGAVADETTMARAGSHKVDAGSFLERSDSFGFFERLGDVIVTGPTGRMYGCSCSSRKIGV